MGGVSDKSQRQGSSTATGKPEEWCGYIYVFIFTSLAALQLMVVVGCFFCRKNVSFLLHVYVELVTSGDHL